jgi:hypothetical protein
MPRPVRSDGKEPVSLHVDKSYRYASSQPMRTDPETGKHSFTRVHWGKVSEDLVFTPNSRFKLATPEQRERLLFPPEWDISAIERLQEHEQASSKGRGRPSYTGEEVNRLYGDIWLLEQVCGKTGLSADLLKVFEGDQEAVADLLTLAFFPYLTHFTYNRVERWQRICKAPSCRPLTPEAITLFLQSITEQQRMDLFRQRKKRLGAHEFLAVDSTSRGCYGTSLSAVRWGKSKDRERLPQVNDLVVYGLESHMPVYYRQLPGNTPDTRTVDVLLCELEHAGFGNTPLVMDRGYASVASLELLMRKGKPFVMCSKVGWNLISREIEALDITSGRPEGFCVDPEYRLYHRQQELAYTLAVNGGGKRTVAGLKLNLYYDPERRGSDMMQVDIDLERQSRDIEQIIEKQLEVNSKEVRRCFPYYTVSLDSCSKHITGFERNELAVSQALRRSGFIAILSHKIAGDSKQVWDWYHLRDEQEKLFSQLKTQMVSRRVRCFSEESHEGRLLVLFTALTLSAHIRQVWKSTMLHEKCTTSLEILDEMRSIRCIEHTGRAKKITPFVGRQVDICDAFGFAIPKGCAPASRKQKKSPKKTARQKKQK